ncbi:MAG: FecR domain-containing protein [Steroidobacter sp.]
MSRRQDPVRALIATQAQTWFALHRAGELTAAQREQFIDWLCESPTHAYEYVALAGFMQDLQQAATHNTTPADVLIARARAEVDDDVVQPMFPTAATVDAASRSSSPSIPAHIWTAMAAVMAMIAVLLAGGWWFHERDHYQTAHAEQRSWRMSDGSTVHLNSSSEIRARFDGRQRRIELVRGQALFQVAKDPKRPFWVYAGDTVVKAVGTEFDVYRQTDRTLISVLEGRVSVWRLPDVFEQARDALGTDASDGMRQLIAQLDGDQQAMISGRSAKVSQRGGTVRKTVAWLQRQVVFDHDPLGSAIEEFNRYAERRIRVDGEELRATQINGIFSAYDAESFLRFLERQPDIRVERGAQEIVVSAAMPAR